MKRGTTQLLEKLASSDIRIAQGVLSERFYPMLFNLARGAGLSKPDAEDVIQESLLVFINKFPDGYDDDKGRLRNWLIGITKRKIMNFKRRLARERVVIENGTSTSFWNLIEDMKAAERTWDNMGSWERYKCCLEQARRESSDRDYKIFELYTLRQEQADYIAEKFNIAEVTVRVISCRVLSKIKQIARKFETTS